MTIINLIENAFSKNDFERVIRLCDEIPENQKAISYKARSLCLLERPHESLDFLDKTNYPDNPYHHYIKAQALMDIEQYGQAIECFEEIFDLEVNDETSLAFMKLDYNICLSLRQDELIEMEKYVDAWKVNLKSQSPYSIEGFTRHVRQYSSRVKSRQYYVRISSHKAKEKLFLFLEKNGFEIKDFEGLFFLIDVVDKICKGDDGRGEITISESKFYDKVNFHPHNKIGLKTIFHENGKIAYEGYVLNGAPYGFGKAYFEDGTLYRDGIFDQRLQGFCRGLHPGFEAFLGVVDQNLAQEKLNRPLASIHQINGRSEPRVPDADRDKQRDDSQTGLAQRENDSDHDLQVVRAVEPRRLLQCIRKPHERCPQNDHVKGAESSAQQD